MQLIKDKDFTYYQKICNKRDAQTIVFVHGFATTSNYHDDYFLDYIKNDYNYYSIQLPGHGVAPLNDKKQLKPIEFAKHVAEWMKVMNFKNINLIGHSMGGGIVLLVSTMVPDLIRKLIMVTPMNPSFSLKHLNVLKFVPKNEAETLMMESLILKDHKKFFPSETHEKTKNETAYQLKHRENFKTLRKEMMTVSNMNYLNKASKKNKLDTLLILGKYDQVIDWKSAEKFYSKLPNYRIEIFDESAHLPFWEETDKYVNLILDFVR